MTNIALYMIAISLSIMWGLFHYIVAELALDKYVDIISRVVALMLLLVLFGLDIIFVTIGLK